METQHKNIPMLELLLRPAFCVSSGKITKINQAAAPYLLSEGADIFSLLATGEEEYRAFESGCLYLTLSICSQIVGATVVAAEDCHLFLLEQASDQAELRALSLAAQQLRGPLSAMSAAANQLSAADPEQLAQFHRRMHQMMRIVSNMSDTAAYCQDTGMSMEYVELCAFLEELTGKVALQLLAANIHLSCTLPAVPIYTLADPQRLERAVYNLISNAAKHTISGGTIHFQLAQRGRLYLSVTNDGMMIQDSNIFTRYLRTPSITDGTDGIGLGMVLIRATATMHGGTVLIDHPNGNSTRVTMTLQQRQHSGMRVRSPIMRIDYAGERDHGLQELADVLPASLYAPEKD